MGSALPCLNAILVSIVPCSIGANAKIPTKHSSMVITVSPLLSARTDPSKITAIAIATTQCSLTLTDRPGPVLRVTTTALLMYYGSSTLLAATVLPEPITLITSTGRQLARLRRLTAHPSTPTLVSALALILCTSQSP